MLSPGFRHIIFQKVLDQTNIVAAPPSKTTAESAGWKAMAVIEAGETTLKSLSKSHLLMRAKLMVYNFRKPQKDLAVLRCANSMEIF